MLENIGRRYLVEHEEAEDGSWWYDRYSDGWLELEVQYKASSPTDDFSGFISFPVAFADKNYSCYVQPFKTDGDKTFRTATGDLYGREINGAYCGWYSEYARIEGMIIEAKGYTA